MYSISRNCAYTNHKVNIHGSSIHESLELSALPVNENVRCARNTESVSLYKCTDFNELLTRPFEKDYFICVVKFGNRGKLLKGSSLNKQLYCIFPPFPSSSQIPFNRCKSLS